MRLIQQLKISLITDTFSQSSSGSVLPASVTSDISSESSSTIASTTIAITSSTAGLFSSSPTSTTTSSSSSVGTPVHSQNTSLPTSINASCGLVSNHTCLGSVFGPCCSQWNWCGITDAYCGTGCQPGYGTCGQPAAVKDKKGAHLKRHRGH
jgi:hypothetical protein